MKRFSLKAYVLALLFALALGFTGCASAPKQKCERQKCSERSRAAESREAPAPEALPAPSHGGDDMERLD